MYLQSIKESDCFILTLFPTTKLLVQQSHVFAILPPKAIVDLGGPVQTDQNDDETIVSKYGSRKGSRSSSASSNTLKEVSRQISQSLKQAALPRSKYSKLKNAEA